MFVFTPRCVRWSIKVFTVNLKHNQAQWSDWLTDQKAQENSIKIIDRIKQRQTFRQSLLKNSRIFHKYASDHCSCNGKDAYQKYAILDAHLKTSFFRGYEWYNIYMFTSQETVPKTVLLKISCWDIIFICRWHSIKYHSLASR